ncbi:MAG: sugar transferase [Patescibacteria group bacterium]|jgi:exopolysaccharide biosynthesis polyprenyl glycosylphosphotransferase
MNTRFKKFVLLFGDILFLYLALYLALGLRYLALPTENIWQAHFAPFSFMFFGWVLIFYISGLYDLYAAVNSAQLYRKMFQSLGIASLLSVGFFYAMPAVGISPKRNLLLFIVIYVLVFILWRRIYNWLLKSQLPKNNLALIGLSNQAKELIGLFSARPQLGFEIKFIVDGGAGQPGIPSLKDITQLKSAALDYKISTLIFASNPYESDGLRAALFDCLPLNIKYVSLANFYEQLTGKVPLEEISQMWFLENLSEGRKNWFDWQKRAYDMLLALAILIATLPFWLLIAIIIKLESRGPVFIRMPRAGKNGKEFRMLKFRSMIEEGNDRSPTKADDPRVTRFGRFMRKTRIDEIPQAINILWGEMSFVGPRPERPELISELEKKIPFYRERMLVKPGVTGWDQISGEYHSPSYEDSLKKLQYDLFYIKNKSIYLDLSILLKTIATVLSRGGR